MTEGEAIAFIVGRKPSGGEVRIEIPIAAAIVTIMFLGGSRHHPAACGVVGELAMVLSKEQLEENLDAPLMASADTIMEGLSDNRHRPITSRFSNDGRVIRGFIHPSELYGMGLSAEGFLDDLDQEDEPSIYNSLDTWARAASRFVNEREMLAVYEREGTA